MLKYKVISGVCDMAFMILVSSAKQRITLLETQCVMSFMKIRNRMGPRTVPCGTPLIIRAAKLSWPSTTTC